MNGAIAGGDKEIETRTVRNFSTMSLVVNVVGQGKSSILDWNGMSTVRI